VTDPGDRTAARAALALLLAAVLWAVAVVTAPMLTRTASSFSPPVFASAVVYGLGSVVCHQRPDRSFQTGGLPWPVCARCAGLYLSAGAGALVAVLWRPRWLGMTVGGRGRGLPMLLSAAAPTAVSWVAERAGLIMSSNAVRAALAVPLGLAVAALMAYAWRSSRGARQLR
jgi:uncharacterized membrane protein